MKLTRTKAPNPRMLAFAPVMDTLALAAIFIALSSSFVLQQGISVAPPFSPFRMGPVKNPQVIAVTAGQPALIFFRNQQTSLPELREKLESMKLESRDGTTLVITADRAVVYDEVLQIANTCIELGFEVILATSSTP